MTSEVWQCNRWKPLTSISVDQHRSAFDWHDVSIGLFSSVCCNPTTVALHDARTFDKIWFVTSRKRGNTKGCHLKKTIVENHKEKAAAWKHKLEDALHNNLLEHKAFVRCFKQHEEEMDIEEKQEQIEAQHQ